MSRSVLFLVAGCLGLAACASDPEPTAQMSAAELAVGQLADTSAPTYALEDTHLARRKLEDAHRAVEQAENVRARRLAEQALVDAQLAQARTDAAIAKKNLTELQASNDALRREAASSSPTR